MILAHLCDEPKGLKTNMCLVNPITYFSPPSPTLLVRENVTLCYVFFLNLKMQSLVYLPFALANALTARLNDGYVSLSSLHSSAETSIGFFCLYKTGKLVSFRVPLVDELWVLLGYCIFTGLLLKQIKPYLALALCSSLH